MHLRVRICVRLCMVLAVGVVLRAQAAPFVPESDSQVLERLPFTVSDPVIRELRALQGRLKDEPNNLPLALRLARGYLELGRVTGDPRYAGYAQAALIPWWDLKQPPEEILVLRATLRQRVHAPCTCSTVARVSRRAWALRGLVPSTAARSARARQGRMPRPAKPDTGAGGDSVPDEREWGDRQTGRELWGT
jgi:hypothetical protein